jgi:hypothetical protein
MFPKVGRIRLSPAKYKSLCEVVLTRDGWACRRCNRRSHLQVHHIIKRSKVRLDVDWNLVTLCERCHTMVERHEVDIVGADANVPDGLSFVVRRQGTAPGP